MRDAARANWDGLSPTWQALIRQSNPYVRLGDPPGDDELESAGLVEARREGTRSVCAVRPEGFAPVEAFVREFWEPRLAVLKSEIEKKK